MANFRLDLNGNFTNIIVIPIGTKTLNKNKITNYKTSNYYFKFL
ncbi:MULTISPECIES: hypothetical protein [unclassified Campylobacter]